MNWPEAIHFPPKSNIFHFRLNMGKFQQLIKWDLEQRWKKNIL